MMKQKNAKLQGTLPMPGLGPRSPSPLVTRQRRQRNAASRLDVATHVYARFSMRCDSKCVQLSCDRDASFRFDCGCRLRCICLQPVSHQQARFRIIRVFRPAPQERRNMQNVYTGICCYVCSPISSLHMPVPFDLTYLCFTASTRY